MKFNIHLPLVNHRGEPLTEGDKPVTLGDSLERACMFAGNPQDSGDVKFGQYKLAQKIARAMILVELSPEEIVKLKGLAAQIFSPLAYGSIVEHLDSPHVEPVTLESLGAVVEAPFVAEDMGR